MSNKNQESIVPAGLMIPGPPGGPAMILAGGAFDGKRMRKAIQRKTVDYFSPMMRYTEVSIVVCIKKYRKIHKKPMFLEPDANFVCNVRSQSIIDRCCHQKRTLIPQSRQLLLILCIPA